MAFDRPFLFGIQPTWGKWVGQGWDWDSTMLQKMADVHCQLARVDSGWDKVEHTEGVYDWAETDHEVDAVLAKGMTPLVWLTDTPPWAAIDGNPKNSPKEEAAVISAFNTFHLAIADRYETKTRYFEFENETNRNTWINPAEFGKWLLRARTKLREGNPDTVLIAGSTWGVDPAYLGAVYDYCIAQGVPHPFGAVAIHPYPPDATGPIDTNAIVAYRNKMVEKGDGDTPMWVTEYGWEWDKWPTENEGHHGYAQRIADALNKLCFGSYDYVEAAIINQLRDIPSSQTWRGICNDDLSPRPGYRIFGVWTKGALLPPESYAPFAVPV